MQEKDIYTYNKSFIAVPIPEGAVLDWLRRLNPKKQFFHSTFFFLGNLDRRELNRASTALVSAARNLQNEWIEIDRLEIIDNGKQAFVLKIKPSQALENVRKTLENDLPEFADINYSFSPHITIQQPETELPIKLKVFPREQLDKISHFTDMSEYMTPIKPKIIGVYYRTDENATALLFSQKI